MKNAVAAVIDSRRTWRHFRFFFVTYDAIEQFPDEACASFLSQHPSPVLPRRIVAHMPSMPAFQIGDPLALFLLMETNNRTLHNDASSL